MRVISLLMRCFVILMRGLGYLSKTIFVFSARQLKSRAVNILFHKKIEK